MNNPHPTVLFVFLSKPSMPLCSYCNLVRIDFTVVSKNRIPLPYSRLDKYPDFPSLAHSAAAGCEVCRVLRFRIQRQYRDKLPKLRSDTEPWDQNVSIQNARFFLENGILNDEYNVEEKANGPYQLVFALHASEIHTEHITLSVYADEGTAAARCGRIQRRLPRLDPLCDGNIEYMMRCITECIEHHKSCDGNDLVELPTRVIDVGNTDTGQEPRLLLPERGAKGRYIALSHCWGLSSPTNPILRTEKETLAARIRGIPITSMPQNFIDAIIAARKLRIQFVWIDSLCIIQDSAEDWAREAAKMHNVYRNAFVTLAATSAQSSQDGFAHRSPSECRPAQVPFYNPETRSIEGIFYLAPRLSHWLDNDFDKYVEGSVWNTRGWTFQERLLSRRVLHFSETVVVFECRAGTISEDNRPSASNVNRTPWLEAEPLGIFIQTWQHLSLEKRFLMQWYILVDRYCIRQLTQKMDKLPALSGLAHEMAAFVGDEYLAGLWRRDLALGLLWNTVDRGDLQACETYRAPSWSWASIDGQIVSFYSGIIQGGLTTCLTIVDAEVHAKDNDPMGAVTAGWLKVIAKLKPISAIILARDPGSVAPHDVLCGDVKVGEAHLDVANESIERPNLFAVLVLLEGVVPQGLLLEGVDGKVEYKRVGTFTFWKGSDRVFRAQVDFFNDCEEQEVTLI